MQITIRELRSGRFVACLPGSERIGPTVATKDEAAAQVSEYAKLNGEPALQLVDEDAVEEFSPETTPEDAAVATDEGALLTLPGDPVERDDVPEGHHLRRHGLWYKLYGPDGEKVGKSRRKAEAAIAEAG